jgi:acetyl-CoA C-acetyltransferase
MRDVAIIGVGMTQWGEIWEKSLRQIFVETAYAAISDAGIEKLDSMYVGSMTPGLFVGQEHLGSLLADYLGQRNIPATRVESACASGGLAVKCAFLEVASGHSDIVMASGVEKMTDISGDGATYALASAADQEYEVFHGATFPGLYAMMARRHMHEFGTTRRQLSAVAVKNHENGSKNKFAQYPFKLTLEGVENSTMIADPLTILDCSPITDGAAAVILADMETAKKLCKNNPIVKIIGVGHATDSIALHDRPSLSGLEATRIAGEKAFKMAGKTTADIDTVEVHDCFTIAEIMVLEELGFCEKGQGGPFTEAGHTAIGGKIPVNTSGGLKSKGHPVGATGVAQIYEITEQLRGNSGERQVEGAKVGLTQNMGGTGGSTVVHILEVV